MQSTYYQKRRTTFKVRPAYKQDKTIAASIHKFFALRVTPPAHPEPDTSRKDRKSRFSKRSRRFSKSIRRPKLSPKTSKVELKTFQNRPQKPSKIEPQTLPNRAQMAPRGGQDGQKIEKEHRPNKKDGWRRIPRPFLKKNVANMVPSWRPKSSKNR